MASERVKKRAGLSRSLAMQFTGHKTEAIYRRYAITSEGNLCEGVDRLNATGQFAGTIAVVQAPMPNRNRRKSLIP